MRSKVWLVVALSLISEAGAQGILKTLSLPDGSKAGLVLPSHPKGKLALVVWLHGGIGANDPAKGIKAATNMLVWADSSNFALLCPSAWPASPWWTPEANRRILDLIRQCGKNPQIDANRIVLAGTSDGGAGALWNVQGVRQQLGKRLKGVAVWSCNPSVLGNYGQAISLASFSGLPVRWAQGGRDRLFALDDVRAWWGQFIAARAKLEPHPIEMAGHDMADWQQDQGTVGAWIRKLP